MKQILQLSSMMDDGENNCTASLVYLYIFFKPNFKLIIQNCISSHEQILNVITVIILVFKFS